MAVVMQIADMKLWARRLALVDAPPVLELTAHVLDAVALAIEVRVVREWSLAVRF